MGFFLFPPCGKTTKIGGKNAFPGAWTRRRQHPKLPKTFEAKVEIQKVLPSVGSIGSMSCMGFPWEFSWDFSGSFMGVSLEFQGGSVVWIYQMIHFTCFGLILRYLQDEWFFVFFFEVKLAWQIQVWLYGYVGLKKVVVSWFCRPRFLLTLGSTNNFHIPMIAILHIQKKCF